MLFATMSTKPRKEKTSFWKKIGLGKNKSSISSIKSEIQRQEHVDTQSMKSKRFSALSVNQFTPEKKIPPLPTKVPDQPLSIPAPKPVPISTDSATQPSLSVDPLEPVQPPASENQSVPPVVTNVTSDDTKKNVSDDTNKADEALSASYVIVSETKEELLSKITDLQAELETQKATVIALQKQKEDIDYLELTVDELFAEKTDLVQQLEDEKIKSQHHLDDLNLLLDKMKSNADHAREQSLAVSQSKQAFEVYQKQAEEDKKALLNQLSLKDQTIQALEHKLVQSQEQAELTMNQLVKSHTAELSQLTTQIQSLQLQLAEQQQYQAEREKLLHTPNGSPRIEPENEKHMSHHAPQLMSRMDSADTYRTSKESLEDDLDDQLLKLTQAKEKLQSAYSKIPIQGGGIQVRRRQEELEVMLDQVDSQLSKVKQKIRKT
ncbi:hypothetical protein A0J61_04367 [Choanephora cucurbitarum]|uniref:Enkurin domain-containing protein n=1 Tax=Choanephora cucurbitarum TaxID=101091 RepID=A0A1C7NEN5_9FUNG|nr:hypothetical protein A0J61_04367 [Choanephora cucurbitarum]